MLFITIIVVAVGAAVVVVAADDADVMSYLVACSGNPRG